MDRFRDRSIAVKSHLPILFPPRFAAVPGADALYPSAAPFTWFGRVGVEIFFVISGFVIARV